MNVQIKTQYNPRVLFHLAQSDGLRQAVPGSVIRTAESNMVARPLRETCSAFLKEGPDIVLNHIFSDFSFSKHWLRAMAGQLEQYEPKPMCLLSIGQSDAWHEHLRMGAIERHFAVAPTRSLIKAFRLPQSVDVVDFVLHARLCNVPYALARYIFPDITDEEATSIFGQITTATTVMRFASILDEPAGS